MEVLKSMRIYCNNLFIFMHSHVLVIVIQLRKSSGNVSNKDSDKTSMDNYLQSRNIKLIFSGGHISLAVAFKGLNVILGLYKWNYSLTVKRELSTAAGQKQGARPDRIRQRAGFGLRALCLPPVVQRKRGRRCTESSVYFLVSFFVSLCKKNSNDNMGSSTILLSNSTNKF